MSSSHSGPPKYHGSRSVGDSPDIGRVSKFRPGFDPRTPGRGERRRRRSTTIAGAARAVRIAKRAGIAFLILLALLAIGGTAWLLRGHKPAVAAAAASEADNASLFPDDDGTADSLPPSEKELVKKARQFVEAKKPTDLPGLVRLSGRSPESLLSQVEEMNKADGTVQGVSYLGSIQNLTQPLEAVLVTFANRRNRIALFCPDAEGKWMIDFDSYSRAASIPWSEIMSGGDIEATIRVYISDDWYYNSRFSDDSKWSCHGLISSDQSGLLFGYAQKDSKADRAIKDALDFKKKTSLSGDPASQRLRMTLTIRHQKGDEDRQFEIVRVIADDWAVPAKALDDHYQ